MPQSAVGDTNRTNAEVEEEVEGVGAGFELVPVFMSGGVGAANPIESVHGVETEFYDFFDKDSHIWDAGYESYMTTDVGSIAEIDEAELELLDIGSLYNEVITPCCTVQAAENIHGQAAGAAPPGFQSTANRSEHPNEQPMPVGSIAPNQSLAICSSAAGSSAAGDRCRPPIPTQALFNLYERAK